MPTVIGTLALTLAFTTLRLPTILFSTVWLGFNSAMLTCLRAAACMTISGFIDSNILINWDKLLISPIIFFTFGYETSNWFIL